LKYAANLPVFVKKAKKNAVNGLILRKKESCGTESSGTGKNKAE
jgi:hypothetical protein